MKSLSLLFLSLAVAGVVAAAEPMPADSAKPCIP